MEIKNFKQIKAKQNEKQGTSYEMGLMSLSLNLQVFLERNYCKKYTHKTKNPQNHTSVKYYKVNIHVITEQVKK